MKKIVIAIMAIIIIFCFLAYLGSKKEKPANSEKTESESLQKESAPRFYDLKVGQTITFGYYEQENVFDNDGKLLLWEEQTLEPIEWVVLAVEDDKALIISKYALDCFHFHDHDGYPVTWETCYTRKWLNEWFYKRAFECYDHDIIATTTVIPDENPENTRQGNITQDKVFLLSVSEAEKYFGSDSARKCRGTEFCYARHAAGDVSENENEKWCVWWLRPSYETTLIPNVKGYNGSIDKRGISNDCGVYVVRPAMWIYINY